MRGWALLFAAIGVFDLGVALLMLLVKPPAWPAFAGCALSTVWAVGMAILSQLKRERS